MSTNRTEGKTNMSNQLVLVLDFGGQYKELIARRVRECNVYSLIKPGNMPLDEIRDFWGALVAENDLNSFFASAVSSQT